MLLIRAVSWLIWIRHTAWNDNFSLKRGHCQGRRTPSGLEKMRSTLIVPSGEGEKTPRLSKTLDLDCNTK